MQACGCGILARLRERLIRSCTALRKVFATVLETLAGASYHTTWTTLTAKQVGCTMRRARWFALARRKDVPVEVLRTMVPPPVPMDTWRRVVACVEPKWPLPAAEGQM